jgi:hypothetical protein
MWCLLADNQSHLRKMQPVSHLLHMAMYPITALQKKIAVKDVRPGVIRSGFDVCCDAGSVVTHTDSSRGLIFGPLHCSCSML